VAQALHPILASRERLLLYLAVWLGFGALLAAVVAYRGDTAFAWAAVYAIPLAVLLGLQSLSCWYLVQVLPANETPMARLTGTWVGAGFVLLAIWVAAALGWAWLLRITVPQALDDEVATGLAPLLLFSGAVGLLVAVLGHYMLVAFESFKQAERRSLELRVLARESELRSLRGQLDPHFLFNSLNSVAALIGTDSQAARRMCFLMAGFFRKSLALGGKQSIPLAEELSLAETFLAIEEVRFGERLRTHFDVAEDVLTLAVPPLILQPLVENAIHHGVAHLLEGGEVTVRARRRDRLLELAVENPCDPERPPSRGVGVGLANVRSRIDALFGHRASVDVASTPTSFRVAILLPAAPAVAVTTAAPAMAE
jgi:two-component system, LytTR family, sensor histidine kinase AlgZ